MGMPPRNAGAFPESPFFFFFSTVVFFPCHPSVVGNAPVRTSKPSPFLQISRGFFAPLLNWHTLKSPRKRKKQGFYTKESSFPPCFAKPPSQLKWSEVSFGILFFSLVCLCLRNNVLPVFVLRPLYGSSKVHPLLVNSKPSCPCSVFLLLEVTVLLGVLPLGNVVSNCFFPKAFLFFFLDLRRNK